MFGHGQVEGFHEKYGMEYRRAYWDEPVDEHLVRVHEERVFPLMRRRRLFSGSADFVLYDFQDGSGVNEDVFAYSNRAGDERGIVLFHNRFAATSGRISMSAAMAADNGQGETVLVRKSLGEALDFNPAGRVYYRFRDAIAGLEYLRAGSELCGQGLQADLAGYEYRVFLDFRELVDDDYGAWGKLCHMLQGRPVESLDDEITQVRYAEVIESFRLAIAGISRLLAAGACAGEELDATGPLLESFYAELNRHTACSGDSTSLANAALRELAAACRAATAAGSEGEEARPADVLLRAAWLLLHDAGRLARTEEHASVAAAWFGELGFDRAFGALVGETPEREEAAECVLLIKLMVRWQGLFADGDIRKAPAGFLLLFSDRVARDFLGVHTYRESEWFVKERFECLVEHLFEVGMVRGEVKEGEDAGPRERSLRKEMQMFKALAAEAGYRVDRFITLLKTD